MPRKARNSTQTNYQHIMVQGLNKEYIFKDDKHIKTYKNIIINKLESNDLTILAYCIMSNHAHFLIYNEEIEHLISFMQKINTSYSRFYNYYNKRVGHVFRDRYLSQDILDQNHLYNCLKYIHNNPVKANIVKSMEDYQYSSFNEFFGEKSIITNNSLKLLFGKTESYMEQFNLIHKTFNEEDFIEVKDKDISKYIFEFQNKLDVKMNEIVNDKTLLIEFINGARMQTDVTFEELAQILHISKSKVGKLAKNAKSK